MDDEAKAQAIALFELMMIILIRNPDGIELIRSTFAEAIATAAGDEATTNPISDGRWLH
jgi:hypothetical protein